MHIGLVVTLYCCGIDNDCQVVWFVRRCLMEHGDPQHAAEELVQKALALHSTDNVTAIVVKFPNSM